MHPRIVRRLIVPLWLALPLTAAASTVAPLHVPQVKVGDAISAMYHCADGKTLAVSYWNASNGQSFALLPVQGVSMLLVSGMSADGVRYQSGFVTWWSKGRGGNLYDARVSADRPVLKDCRSMT